MPEERNYTLYKITSPDSPKFYIGITGRTVSQRFAQHKSTARRYTHKSHRFYEWLRKHGRTAEVTPMLIRLTREVALELERITVDLCFKHEAKLILNTGAGGGAPMAGRKLSAESRARISAAHRGRKQSAEIIHRRVDARNGYKHSEEVKAKIGGANRGKVRPAELKFKMSAIRKGRKSHPNAIAGMVAANIRAVMGVKKDGEVVEFRSVTEAARSVGKRPHQVSGAISRGLHCAGIWWWYK